ncbi:MAG: glycosyltransferase [bacterium]
MPPVVSSIIYMFMFFLVYYQVFILLTFFEHKHEFKKYPTNRALTDQELPAVTILVPIFNEEKTVDKTIASLLSLNYPKDKLQITIVDDGSTDNTWNIVQKYKNVSNIALHKKENGGKFTALNYGIENCITDFVGCLDADSEVDAEALRHIVPYFDNPEIMAVTPSLKIKNPDTILGLMQNAEYNLGIFLRKIMGLIDAQYVTPGPFSIFRKNVFETIGNYHHAHNTEDLEMALRMQSKHMKITCADKAVVYTVGPRNLYRLYKQRVRWTGGFIQNALDYKHMILNPKYGNLGMLVLPITMWTIVGTMFALGYSVFELIVKSMKAFNDISVVGLKNQLGEIGNTFSVNLVSQFKEWMYYHVQGTFFLSLFSFSIVIFAVWYGRKIANVKDSKKMDIVYFLMLYSLIAPIWLATSVYNTIRKRDAAWR